MSTDDTFDNSEFVLRVLDLEDICRIALVAVHAVAETPEQREAARLVEVAFDSQQSIINKLVEQQIEYSEMMDELVAKVRLFLEPK